MNVVIFTNRVESVDKKYGYYYIWKDGRFPVELWSPIQFSKINSLICYIPPRLLPAVLRLSVYIISHLLISNL